MTKLIINDRYQLIDLNKANTMFDINLIVNSKEEEEFQACIISQNQLDNGNQPEFRNFKGKMKVHLKNLDEESSHETQYLCIKKIDGTLEIEYDIIYNDLPEKEENPSTIENYQPPIPKIKKTIFTLRNLIILILVIVIGYLLYSFWIKKTIKDVPLPPTTENIKDVVKKVSENTVCAVEDISENVVVEPIKEVVEKVKESIKSPSLNSSESELDFLSKLKKLQNDE